MPYLLGMDVATTGTKALLIDEKGKVVASVTKEYPLSTPCRLWSEQDPTDWWEGTMASIRELLEASAVGAGIYTSVEEACETTVHTLEQTLPLEEHQPLYNRYYAIYCSLCGASNPPMMRSQPPWLSTLVPQRPLERWFPSLGARLKRAWGSPRPKRRKPAKPCGFRRRQPLFPVWYTCRALFSIPIGSRSG